MPDDLFTLISPTASEGSGPLPVVANLPHSGLRIPAAIASQFTEAHLRSLPNSDWHLQPLYSFLPDLGVTVLQANYSRYVVDLNRTLKPPFLGSFWSSVVPQATAFKQPIYREPVAQHLPDKAAVRDRIHQFYTPYHQQLAALLNQAVARHGRVLLLDLHSFMGIITDDVCLGNAKGQTCSAATLNTVANSFAQQGYGVVKNKVFSGGYITRHYGHQPAVEALQIELRYPTYLAEYEPAAQIPAAQIPAAQIPTWQSPTFDAAQAKLKAAFKDMLPKLCAGA